MAGFPWKKNQFIFSVEMEVRHESSKSVNQVSKGSGGAGNGNFYSKPGAVFRVETAVVVGDRFVICGHFNVVINRGTLAKIGVWIGGASR